MEKTQEKPRLTKQERAFVEAFDEKIWIAKDEHGSLFLFYQEPVKDDDYGLWDDNQGNRGIFLNDELFPFITWESEKAWSKDDLLALEVEEDTPAEKTAKEMFETFGWEQDKNNSNVIEYCRGFRSIVFLNYDKEVVPSCHLTMDWLKAINKQCEELGWIE